MFPESYPRYLLTTRENREKILAEIFKAVWKEKIFIISYKVSYDQLSEFTVIA